MSTPTRRTVIKTGAALAAGATVLGGARTAAAATVQAIIYPNNKVPISPTVYGANNEWRSVTREDFPGFNAKLLDYGYQLLRFPGGWESEHYDWVNDDTGDWPEPDLPLGATGEQAANAADHVGFVMRTSTYMNDPTAANRDELVQQAVAVVDRYGDRVKHWMIGNEWWLQWAGGATLTEKRHRYALLARRMANAIKNHQSEATVYVTGRWTVPADFAEIKAVFDVTGSWGSVDGVDLHLYMNKSGDTGYAELPRMLGDIKQASGKSKIIASEWHVNRDSDREWDSLRNANSMAIALHAMIRNGVTAATYWPATDGNAPGNGLTYQNASGWQDLPQGQVLRWMANSMNGDAVATGGGVETAASNDTVRKRITVLIATKELADTPVQVSFANTDVTGIVSAEALWMTDPTVRHTAANVATLSPAFDNANNTVTVRANPGGTGRGSSYELLRLIVSYL